MGGHNEGKVIYFPPLCRNDAIDNNAVMKPYLSIHRYHIYIIYRNNPKSIRP